MQKHFWGKSIPPWIPAGGACSPPEWNFDFLPLPHQAPVAQLNLSKSWPHTEWEGFRKILIIPTLHKASLWQLPLSQGHGFKLNIKMSFDFTINFSL